MKRKSILRRAVLASLVVAAFAAPALGSGCGGGYAPISQVDGLRVLAVIADKPYAQPGDTVTFKMTYSDPPGSPRRRSSGWVPASTPRAAVLRLLFPAREPDAGPRLTPTA